MKTIIKITDKVLDGEPNISFIFPVTSIRYMRIMELLPMKFKIEEMTNETDSLGQHVASMVISIGEEQDIRELIGVLFEGTGVLS